MTKVIGCTDYMYRSPLSNMILLKGKLLDPVICEYFFFLHCLGKAGAGKAKVMSSG